MKKDLTNSLTIENAVATAKELSEYIKSADEPVIDLSSVEKLDLAGIQLLISAQETVQKKKKNVFYTGTLKKNIYDRIFGCGFNIVHSPDSNELFRIRRNSSEI